jgi:hypothetical protein
MKTRIGIATRADMSFYSILYAPVGVNPKAEAWLLYQAYIKKLNKGRI